MITNYQFRFKDIDCDELEITRCVDGRIMITIHGNWSILTPDEFYKFIGSLLKIQADLKAEIQKGGINETN